MDKIQTTNATGNAYQMESRGTKMVAVYNSQIIEGDEWWNVIQAVDPTYDVSRSYPLNRTLFFKFPCGTYGIAALDVLMNVANLILTGPFESIMQIMSRDYLVETIKTMNITTQVANNIGFIMTAYGLPVLNLPMTGNIVETSLGRKVPAERGYKTEYKFVFKEDWKLRTYTISQCFPMRSSANLFGGF